MAYSTSGKTNQGTYNIDPVDYPKKPLFAAATDNRLRTSSSSLYCKMCTNGKASESSSL